MQRNIILIGLLASVLLFSDHQALAKSKRRGRKYYPPLTHPVVLWSRTLADSPDFEQRKVAAFKLSQYSQSIYQEEVVKTLLTCLKDTDEHIKVFCTKALGKATNKSKEDAIRKALIDQYKNDAHLRGTITRVFISRKDRHPSIQDTLIDTLKESQDLEEALPAIEYFEKFGSQKTVDPLIAIYKKSDNLKIRREIVKALSELGDGQDSVVSLLSECAENRDTTLVLNCLAALQVQAKRDSKTVQAVEKTIESSDPDVILATLELIQSLPETPNDKISTRLLELIEEDSENEIVEKSILALGVCGNHSEAIVSSLQKSLEKKGAEDGIRISAALSLGKQSEKFPDGPKTALTECKTSNSNSKSLITACQLALQELQARASKTKSSALEKKESPINSKKSKS